MDEQTNHYITSNQYIAFSTDASYNSNGVAWTYNAKSDAGATSKIAPELYFKYVKSKFGILDGMRIRGRLKRLEKAALNAIENGQEMMSEKFMREISRETRESVLYAKGFKHFIEREDLVKFKQKIREGHISDTLFKNFMRVIPKDILAKKKKAEPLFDDFVIYHYYNEDAQKKIEKKQKLTPSEHQAMRDPVLFGIIKETNRLYFIADWDDEFCDLSFEELVDKIGKSDEEFEIPREPKLNV